jgi:hypothetical protein
VVLGNERYECVFGPDRHGHKTQATKVVEKLILKKNSFLCLYHCFIAVLLHPLSTSMRQVTTWP